MNANSLSYLRSRRPITLVLGNEYVIMTWNGLITCRFIKVTAKVFNLLNIETSKCILINHLYESKKIKGLFFINKHLVIKHCNKLNEK